jgi:hypothetical protein
LQAIVLNQIGNSSRAFCAGNPTEGLKFDGDGRLSLRIENELPGEEEESNRLPASKGSTM